MCVRRDATYIGDNTLGSDIPFRDGRLLAITGYEQGGKQIVGQHGWRSLQSELWEVTRLGIRLDCYLKTEGHENVSILGFLGRQRTSVV